MVKNGKRESSVEHRNDCLFEFEAHVREDEVAVERTS